MNESIERLDQKRKGALKTYLLGGLLFYGAWISGLYYGKQDI